MRVRNAPSARAHCRQRHADQKLAAVSGRIAATYRIPVAMSTRAPEPPCLLIPPLLRTFCGARLSPQTSRSKGQRSLCKRCPRLRALLFASGRLEPAVAFAHARGLALRSHPMLAAMARPRPRIRGLHLPAEVSKALVILLRVRAVLLACRQVRADPRDARTRQVLSAQTRAGNVRLFPGRP